MKKRWPLTIGVAGFSLLSALPVVGCGAKGGNGSKVAIVNNHFYGSKKDAFASYKLEDNIELSTNPDTPNLIEIFADGLDPLWTQAILGDEQTKDTRLKSFDPEIGTYHEFGKENGVELHTSFKDFTSFPNFFTGFSATIFGKASELGGRNFNVPAVVEGLKNVDRSEDFEIDAWRVGTESEAMRSHFLVASDNFVNATVFNEVDTMRPYDKIIDSWDFLDAQQKEDLKFAPHSDIKKLNYDGDTDYARMFFNEQNINFYSFGEATNIAKEVQSNLTGEASQAFAAMKLLKINNDQKGGGRILIQHNASHPPRNTGYNGTSDRFPDDSEPIPVDDMTWRHKGYTATSLDVAHGAATDLTNARYVLDKLKALKDDAGRSAYDNSMIVIFGDHSDHERAQNRYKNIQDAKVQDNSELLVKFPNANNKSDYPLIDINHTVWGGDMNTIIEDYFKDKPKNPMTIFNDPTFALNRPLLICNRNYWDTKFAFGSLNDDNEFIWDGENKQTDFWDEQLPQQTFGLFEKSTGEIYNKLFPNDNI